MNADVEVKLNRFKSRATPWLIGSKNPSYKHGMTGTPIYKIWGGMLSRCYNPKVKIYKYYGGRGIQVCERWFKFENFYSDMGNRPDGMQLDRIDNNSDYSPENCKWVTPRENNPANKGTLKDDMPGKRFGKWIVLNLTKHKIGHRYYFCKCDCGTEKIIAGGQLRRGGSTQCRRCKDFEHKSKHKDWHVRKNI